MEGSAAGRSGGISFVIASRDEPPDVLQRTIDGLLATSPAAEREIVVVDDGSRDPVRVRGTDLHLIRNAEPVGSSLARRMGCAVATGRVLVSLDAHMTFADDWLDRMLDHVESDALLCAAFWDYELRRPGAFGADLRWSAVRDYSSRRHPGLIAVHRTTHPGPGASEVPALLGACYMMLRTTYDTLGGYSPLFRVWGAEEQDLSMRAWKAGFAVRCVADARVGHLSRTVFPYPVVYDHVELNQLLFLRTVFEHRTIDRLERDFRPVPPATAAWLADTDITQWRALVRSTARVSDREVFARVVPELVPMASPPAAPRRGAGPRVVMPGAAAVPPPWPADDH